MTIGELHVEALSPENRVLNYKIDLLAPFPKRESRWVKETGGWIHEKKKQRRILGTKEARQWTLIPRKFVALHHRNTKIKMRSDEREQKNPFFVRSMHILSARIFPYWQGFLNNVKKETFRSYFASS